jgi:hypothetical protein
MKFLLLIVAITVTFGASTNPDAKSETKRTATSSKVEESLERYKVQRDGYMDDFFKKYKNAKGAEEISGDEIAALKTKFSVANQLAEGYLKNVSPFEAGNEEMRQKREEAHIRNIYKEAGLIMEEEDKEAAWFPFFGIFQFGRFGRFG